MESEVLQAFQDLGLENPQAAVEEILSYSKDCIKDCIDETRDQVIERVLDHFSDKWGIGKRELEPVIHQVCAGSVYWSFSVPEAKSTLKKATDTKEVD